MNEAGDSSAQNRDMLSQYLDNEVENDYKQSEHPNTGSSNTVPINLSAPEAPTMLQNPVSPAEETKTVQKQHNINSGAETARFAPRSKPYDTKSTMEPISSVETRGPNFAKKSNIKKASSVKDPEREAKVVAGLIKSAIKLFNEHKDDKALAFY